MIFFRVALILFNVVAFVVMIMQLVKVFNASISSSKKSLLIAVGVIVLLSPLGFFTGILVPSLQYFFVYPVTLFMYVYLVRRFVLNY